MSESMAIYSIGHSNHSTEKFLDLLSLHGIEQLVDVRSVPYSRFAPQFNGQSLNLWLQEHDLEYAFAGEFLGGRPSEGTYYKSGQVPSGKADYLSLVDYAAVANAPWFGRGITRLIEIANSKKSVIMCSEEDPRRCHRHHLIEPALRDKAVMMLHIRKDGSLESIGDEEAVGPGVAAAQLALFGLD